MFLNDGKGACHLGLPCYRRLTRIATAVRASQNHFITVKLAIGKVPYRVSVKYMRGIIGVGSCSVAGE